MKKLSSQITVAIVCAILGFMLSYQFKMLAIYNKKQSVSKTATDITVEIEQYKKEKTDLQKKVDELQSQVKNYENAAAGKSDATKELLSQLENSRTLAGATDVQGPGITIYLKPSSKIFGNKEPQEEITDKLLSYLVNELRYAEAEAISINGTRITSKTGIRSASNNTYILINDQKISPNSLITITAIGDKNLLYQAIAFPNTLAEFNGVCEVSFEKSDKISIGKYNKPFSFQYAKPVK